MFVWGECEHTCFAWLCLLVSLNSWCTLDSWFKNISSRRTSGASFMNLLHTHPHLHVQRLVIPPAPVVSVDTSFCQARFSTEVQKSHQQLSSLKCCLIWYKHCGTRQLNYYELKIAVGKVKTRQLPSAQWLWNKVITRRFRLEKQAVI